MQKLRRFAVACRKAAANKLPGHQKSVWQKAKELPAKLVDYTEARLEEAPLRNQLTAAQTETEFVKQELQKAEARLKNAQAHGQELDNFERELQILQRIQEITDGKTAVHAIQQGDISALVFADVIPRLTDETTSGESPVDDPESDEADDSPDSIEVLELSTRVLNVLVVAEIETCEQLAAMTVNQLLDVHGIGLASVAEIEEALSSHGKALATS